MTLLSPYKFIRQPLTSNDQQGQQLFYSFVQLQLNLKGRELKISWENKDLPKNIVWIETTQV